MRGHIFACYWIGVAVGLMIGVLVGSGIRFLACSGDLRLPSITMGDHVRERPALDPAQIPELARQVYASITALLMGDPPIGRSALDRRHQ
jgi:hypothetical protein